MASKKNRQSFEKRRKEEKRRRKQEEKRQRRFDKKNRNEEDADFVEYDDEGNPIAPVEDESAEPEEL